MLNDLGNSIVSTFVKIITINEFKLSLLKLNQIFISYASGVRKRN